MANNYNQSTGNQDNQYYDQQYQPYQADEHMGPYYENNPTSNRRGYRGGARSRGGGRGFDNEARSGRGQGNSQRGGGVGYGRGSFNNERGRGFSNQRGERGNRGKFDPLPAQVDWIQQLEKDRKNASLNWAPSFRAANIQIPNQFFAHTKDEQSVLGQELMDLGEAAAKSAQTGLQQAPGRINAQPMDMAALDLEASNVAGD